jgi:alpha-beta hydrolase superfamily lysophospholipase
MWPFAAAAGQRGVHVVVPDLPGYGRTRVPRRGAVRYPDWARP